jgi:hypothetical protein
MRLGVWRYGWSERYVNKDLPAPLRNAAFALLPLGLGILMVTPSLTCDPGQCSNTANAFALSGVGLLLVGVAAFFFPFGILKPRWLLTMERSGGTVTGVVAPHLSRGLSVAILVVVVLLMVVAITTGWLTWSPGTLLLVIGLAILGAVSRLNRKRGP